MSDDEDETDVGAETEDGELFELERRYERTELAALFQEFGSALADGVPLTVETDAATVSMDVPAELLVELECEREGRDEGGEGGEGEDEANEEDQPTVEFEIELEWADESGESVRVEPLAESVADASDSGDEAAVETDDSSGEAVIDADAEDSGGEAVIDAERERTAHFEVYRDRAEEWRWRLVHWNGNVIADSGEGYATRRNAVRGLESVRRNAPEAGVEHVDR